MAAKATESSSRKVQRGTARFDGRSCGACGGATRKIDKRQWWICERGHRLVRKSR